MASEMRRMAGLLVERRSESFESRYSREESALRVERVIAGITPKAMVFETSWRESPDAPILDVTFSPSPGTRRFLNIVSVALTLLLAATVWALMTPGEPPVSRVLIAVFMMLALLAFPFVMVAYGSRREAEEANLRRAIRKAIVDEERGAKR
jgi:hypothetical protein